MYFPFLNEKHTTTWFRSESKLIINNCVRVFLIQTFHLLSTTTVLNLTVTSFMLESSIQREINFNELGTHSFLCPSFVKTESTDGG